MAIDHAAATQPITAGTPTGYQHHVTVPIDRSGRATRLARRLGHRGALTLIIVGAFALTLGLVLPHWVYPRLAVIPLDPQTTVVSSGQAAVLFDRANLVIRRDVTLTATVQVRGDLGAPEAAIGGDTAVWLLGTVVTDDRNVVVSTNQTRVCVDRRTSMAARDCTGQYVVYDSKINKGVRATGLVSKFPFNTQRRDYPFFDANSRSAPPMRFAGTEEIDGLPVYRFVQSVPATKFEDTQVPGSLVGLPDRPSVPAGRFQQTNRVVWVEPTSGLIVRDQQALRQVLRGPRGGDGTVVLDADLTLSSDSVRRAVVRAKETKQRLELIAGRVPNTIAAVGLVLLAFGGFAVVRRRRGATGGAGRPRGGMPR